MAATGMTSAVGRDQFLKLMVAQMKAQDPLEPMNNQEFTSQLAQFSTLEGIEKLNTSFGDMLALQQLTQGAGLIGKAVTYSPANSSAIQTGTVQGFSLDAGQLQLQVNGQAVPIGQIKGMTSAA